MECSVHNVLHVVARAGTGGRLGPTAIHASRPAGMHKIQSLLTYVKHFQSPRIFQDTLYISSSQQCKKCKQMSQNLMSLRGGCPWAKSADTEKGQNLGFARYFIFKWELYKTSDTLHTPAAMCVKKSGEDIFSFVECSVHNVLHVAASAGIGGRLGPMAIHTSLPAGMHKFRSLVTYVKHVQWTLFFQDTRYIFSSQ